MTVLKHLFPQVSVSEYNRRNEEHKDNVTAVALTAQHPGIFQIQGDPERKCLSVGHAYIDAPPPTPALTCVLFEGNRLWSTSASVESKLPWLAQTANERRRAERVGRLDFDNTEVAVSTVQQVRTSWPPRSCIEPDLWLCVKSPEMQLRITSTRTPAAVIEPFVSCDSPSSRRGACVFAEICPKSDFGLAEKLSGKCRCRSLLALLRWQDLYSLCLHEVCRLHFVISRLERENSNCLLRKWTVHKVIFDWQSCWGWLERRDPFTFSYKSKTWWWECTQSKKHKYKPSRQRRVPTYTEVEPRTRKSIWRVNTSSLLAEATKRFTVICLLKKKKKTRGL